MANTKISALTSATTPLAGTETLPIVQSSTTKQVSVANLTAGRTVSATSMLINTASAVSATQFSVAYNGGTNNGIGINETAGTSGTAYMYFNLSGVNIGTITRAGATSAVTYNTVSDRRLKSNIVSLTPEQSGPIIDGLLPRTFTWNVNGASSIGFITDEFQTQFPNAVTGEPNAVDIEGNPRYQMGDFSTAELMAVLVAEIQSLKARLKAANIP
jgi:hypothetical protein